MMGMTYACQAYVDLANLAKREPRISRQNKLLKNKDFLASIHTINYKKWMK
jgi:hypothetical protein